MTKTEALSEMLRVTKKGWLVLAVEPNNLNFLGTNTVLDTYEVEEVAKIAAYNGGEEISVRVICLQVRS